MPSADTQPLFDEAARLRVGFSLGYAELTADGHRYNAAVLVERDGQIVAKYRKVHIPGHENTNPGGRFSISSATTSSRAPTGSACGRPSVDWSA